MTSYQLPIGFPTFKAVGKSVRGFVFCITMSDWSSSQLTSPGLEETNGFAHCALDVQRLNILPVLLEKRNEEVNAYDSVRRVL